MIFEFWNGSCVRSNGEVNEEKTRTNTVLKVNLGLKYVLINKLISQGVSCDL